ncbi:MAG: hypothetical protein KIS91_17915, partial [Anaerolineae bacterium]|nr:hypothetical protein [Anaerolineae bacterium]
ARRAWPVQRHGFSLARPTASDRCLPTAQRHGFSLARPTANAALVGQVGGRLDEAHHLGDILGG